MEWIVGTCFATGALFVMLLRVESLCIRWPQLRRSRQLLRFVTLLWWTMPLLKIFFIDGIVPPSDAIHHEFVAREVADCLRHGNYRDAFGLFGMSNEFYRFVIGVFYFLTDAPEYVVYLLNGFAAYWGLSALLDMLCGASDSSEPVPARVILLTMATPSPLFWSTTNLKEGLMLWGICMMILPAFRGFRDRKCSLFVPAIGCAVVLAMRPHIAGVWLAAVVITMIINQGRFVLGGLACLVLVGAMFALVALVPGLAEQIGDKGATETMDSYYDIRKDIGGSALKHTFGFPIPFVSGLTLILLRPYPGDINSGLSLLSALEIWTFAAFMAAGWYRCQQRSQFIWRDAMILSFVSLLGMSLFFTYIYNMGLALRQRVQVWPALVLLAAYPMVAKRLSKGAAVGVANPPTKSRIAPRRVA